MHECDYKRLKLTGQKGLSAMGCRSPEGLSTCVALDLGVVLHARPQDSCLLLELHDDGLLLPARKAKLLGVIHRLLQHRARKASGIGCTFDDLQLDIGFAVQD